MYRFVVVAEIKRNKCIGRAGLVEAVWMEELVSVV